MILESTSLYFGVWLVKPEKLAARLQGGVRLAWLCRNRLFLGSRCEGLQLRLTVFRDCCDCEQRWKEASCVAEASSAYVAPAAATFTSGG